MLAAALAVAATASAACGRTTAVGGDRTLRVAVTEYRLIPQHARVSAGLLIIVLHNYGRLTHNLAVSSGGTMVASTDPVAPGGSYELNLDLAPGRYTLASTLLSDQVLGAYGSLTVTR